MKIRLAVKAISTFCVLSVFFMLCLGCLSMVFMSHPSEQMYEASAVKAHFSSFGFIYLALTAALVFAGILSLFLKKTPEKSGECDKYRRIEPLCALKTPFARIALLSVCAVLIVLGIVNGGLRDVFVKAVNICTECIGLG